MSAEIIAFVPRPRNRKLKQTPTMFRSQPSPDDLTMDHADTAPCEYAPSWECDEHEPA
jgi:hypothetical protein